MTAPLPNTDLSAAEIVIVLRCCNDDTVRRVYFVTSKLVGNFHPIFILVKHRTYPVNLILKCLLDKFEQFTVMIDHNLPNESNKFHSLYSPCYLIGFPVEVFKASLCNNSYVESLPVL